MAGVTETEGSRTARVQGERVHLVLRNTFIEVAHERPHRRARSWSPPRSRCDDEDRAWSVEVFVTKPAVSQVTVMLRDLPERFCRQDLLALLESGGFQGSYTFVYVPISFGTGLSTGYAIVSFSTTVAAQQFFMDTCAHKPAWNEVQGVDQLVERYHNRAVMHPTVPQDYKPMLFNRGESVSFPEPKFPVKKPRVRPLKLPSVSVSETSTDAGESDRRSRCSSGSAAGKARWADQGGY